MSARHMSRGKCAYCGNAYAKSGMSRHLQACKARKAATAAEEAADAPVPRRKLFHLSAEGTYASDYWLHLEVPASATLEDLDRFLRDIWLECCGHLSMFQIAATSYQCMAFDDTWGTGDPDMDVELGEVLRPGVRFSHEYDFGTTTYLTLKVVAEREGYVKEEDEQVQVMARNEPPDYRCEICGRPATLVDVFGDYNLLCDNRHETVEYGEGLLPIVNSPRVGMCGYVGDAW